jgi:hypothetical protein
MQYLPNFCGSGDLEGKLLQDATNFSHLFGITRRLDPGTEVEVVLEPYANVRSQNSSHRQKGHLVTPCAQHREMIILSPKQPVSRGSHDKNILRVWTEPAKDSEDSLDKDRGLDYFAIDEVGKVIEMTDIIAFEFKTGTRVPKIAKDVFNVREGILEDEILHALDLLLLPRVMPLRDALGDGMN